jgi:hypothetical protein
MKVTLTASSGAQVVVWQGNDAYYARPVEEASEPEICLAVDLFEVIADLAGLDLEDATQAAEAMSLAQQARERTNHSVAIDSDDEEELGAEQCQNGA